MSGQVRFIAVLLLFTGSYLTLSVADLSAYQCQVCLTGRMGFMPCIHMQTFANRSVSITSTFSEKKGESLCNLAEIPIDVPRCVINYADGSKINPKLQGKVSADGKLCSTAMLAAKSSFPMMASE